MPKSGVNESDRIIGWFATAPLEQVQVVMSSIRSIVARRSYKPRGPKKGKKGSINATTIEQVVAEQSPPVN